jgi:osmotically-inducible protein OsmY
VEYGRQRQAAELTVAGLVDVTWLVQGAPDRNVLADDDSDVSGDTSGNTVALRGHVRTWAERDTVVGAAWMAGGVMQVPDDLDIIG